MVTKPFRSLPLFFAASGLFAFTTVAASAQTSIGGGQPTPFRDPGVLVRAQQELPAGHKVAIVEFEDLECPACAHAAPIVKIALDHYKVVFERHDFLINGHMWSKDAAITARYLEDKVSPDQGEMYRRDVFANQTQISSKDDLNAFTKRWFDAHHLPMPFVMDPTGRFALEVQQDVNLGQRLGLQHTPTIVVIGPKGWIEVNDPAQLYTALDRSIAEGAPAVAHNNTRRPTTAQR